MSCTWGINSIHQPKLKYTEYLEDVARTMYFLKKSLKMKRIKPKCLQVAFAKSSFLLENLLTTQKWEE